MNFKLNNFTFPLMALVFSLAMLLSIAPANAKTQYLSDELRVPLRQTPCDRCKIIHHGLPSGTTLTVIESNKKGWSHIKTKGGLEGWLPSQYLKDQQIARYRIVDVEKQLSAALNENKTLKAQLNSLSNEKSSVEEMLQTELASLSELDTELENIKRLSSNVIAINQQNEELLTRNNMLQGELDILAATNKQLRANNNQNWFFYGALSVFMSALLVILVPRLRRRKTFSEWG